jgi:uncharacterized repeat protein (TIGR03803 family)
LGSAGSGTVFKISTNGSGFTILHTFASHSGSDPHYVNTDGVAPTQLVVSGDTLYGITGNGGAAGSGTVFSLKTDGSHFKTLHVFSNADGDAPTALILSGNSLYGVTFHGGTWGGGTVFSLSLMPQLSIFQVVSNLVLTWRSDDTRFSLQATTNLASPVWITVSPGPIVVSGQYTVTNPISGTQQFFRLSQ